MTTPVAQGRRSVADLPASCVACEGLTSSLSANEVKEYESVIPSWKANSDYTKISKLLRLKSFKSAMDYLAQIAAVAESEGHHPDLRVYGYNNVLVELSTHKLGGITHNDIVMAVKIDAIPVSLSRREADRPPVH